MPLQVFANGEEPTYTKLNAVSQQTVITGNSPPGSPVEGMNWFDTNAAHPLQYIYNGSAWWPIPMGLIAKGTIANTGTGYLIGATETTVNSSNLTFTAENDQRYAYEADVNFTCNEADDLIEFKLQTWDGSTWTDFEDPFYERCVANNTRQRVSVRSINGPGAGTSGWRVRVKLYYGTGSLQIEGGTDCSISHIGSSTLV